MQERVLVLNANFEPINVCSTKRAICLILTGKASLVLNGRGEIRTTRNAYPLPSIIRLEKMIRRPRPSIRLTKREILRRDNFICQYCGSTGIHLTIDHVHPRHSGGEHSWENLVAACSACNHRKGSRTLDQSGMKLLRTPTEPSNSAFYIFARHLSENSEWYSFINGW